MTPPLEAAPLTGGESRFAVSDDGLRLHFRDYANPASLALPVVCLPGLARTGDDFFRLAARLNETRRVLTLDCRGRGLSDWDGDPRRYALPVECRDIGRVLASARVSRAHFVGTSRGGLQIMALAAAAPELIASAVLNDIGPVVETEGLDAIRAYLGKTPAVRSYAEAAVVFRRRFGSSFSALGDDDWEIYARLTLEQREGAWRLRYDPRLAQTLGADSAPTPPANAWPLFEALAGRPCLALRGENSTLLSAATLAEMGRRHRGCKTLVVRGQGHAPMLLDAPTLDAIADFIGCAERGAAG